MGVDILNGRVIITGCALTDAKTGRCGTFRKSSSSSEPVKRCLFGPVDHDEVMSFFRRELTKLNLEKIRKWNFDFVAGQPLSGNFEWRRVVCEPVANIRAKVTKSKTNKRSPLKTVKFASPNTAQGVTRKDIKRGDQVVGKRYGWSPRGPQMLRSIRKHWDGFKNCGLLDNPQP